MDETVTLFRPVGQKEFELVREGGFRFFPPRLPNQPILYPVLTRSYAEQIARQWNTRDAGSGHVGYVLQFSVKLEFLGRYEVHCVGDSTHQEYWIPAADLEEFNRNITGRIEVVAEFRSSVQTS